MSKKLRYQYEFIFPDGKSKTFGVDLDENTLLADWSAKCEEMCRKSDDVMWAKLDFHKCEVCPLTMEDADKYGGFCPAALAVFDAVNFFKDKISYEEVEMKITTPSRGYFKKTKIQEGLGAFIGLLMATSGCPVLEKLKPMAVVHLPFARAMETVYRVASMYLLSQYFVMKKGGTPDWEMKNLVAIYDDVRQVNKSFSQRISSVVQKDASANAIVILDCFAIATTLSITKGEIRKLENFFKPYLK